MITYLLWIAFGCAVLGTMFGLVGIWVPDVWKDNFGQKCLGTFAVIAIGSCIGASILTYIK